MLELSHVEYLDYSIENILNGSMDVNSNARNYLFSLIEKTVFTQNFKELSEVTQQNFNWAMNFKVLSLDKEFLLAFVSLFDSFFQELENVQVCGMESGALPFLAALRLHSAKCKNAFYIRKSAKKSDLAKTVEGIIDPNLPIIIIDDLLNNGKTIKKQLVVLEEEGFDAIACFTILRFRDRTEYASVFGEQFKIKSIFELNDFSSSLGLANLKKSPAALPDFYAWKGVWKISLSQSNPYIVVPKSGPVLQGDHIYMGGDDGYMRAIDKNTGKIIWQTSILFGEGGKRIFSTPAIRGTSLFFGAYDGNFYCLDAITGKKKWIYKEAEWIGSSPAVAEYGKTVFVGLEFGLFKKKGGLAALDIETGNPRWVYYDMEGLTHASPAVSTKLKIVVCGCNDYYVYCFNEKSGEFLWKFKTNDEVKYSAVFDEKRKLVIIGSMDGTVYCLDAQTGTPKFEFKGKAGFYSTPVLHQDKIIIGSLDKRVYCFDLVTNKTVWSVLTRGRIFSSPFIYKESVFVGSNDGGVYEIDWHSGKTTSITQLPNRVVNRVIVADDPLPTLYVSTDTCDLYKFEKWTGSDYDKIS